MRPCRKRESTGRLAQRSEGMNTPSRLRQPGKFGAGLVSRTLCLRLTRSALWRVSWTRKNSQTAGAAMPRYQPARFENNGRCRRPILDVHDVKQRDNDQWPRRSHSFSVCRTTAPPSGQRSGRQDTWPADGVSDTGRQRFVYLVREGRSRMRALERTSAVFCS